MLVKQILNFLDLIDFFAEGKQSASLAEISAHFGWPRSSTFNILSTLIDRGFLYEPRARGAFYPTPRLLVLAREITSADPIPEQLVKLARQLRESTGETGMIGAPSGQNVVFIEVFESNAPIRYSAEVGKRVPIHATGSGQALLSQMSEDQRAALLRKATFERYGAGTPMSVESVEESIRESLHRGWFESASSFSPDLGGVSVPIVIDSRIFVASIAGPLFRVRSRADELAHILQDTVEAYLGRGFLARTVPDLKRLI